MNNEANFSNTSLKAGVAVDQWVTSITTALSRSLAERGQGDRGQGVLEYAGVLLVVAAIVVGLMKFNIDKKITPIINDAIKDVKGA